MALMLYWCYIDALMLYWCYGLIGNMMMMMMMMNLQRGVDHPRSEWELILLLTPVESFRSPACPHHGSTAADRQPSWLCIAYIHICITAAHTLKSPSWTIELPPHAGSTVWWLNASGTTLHCKRGPGHCSCNYFSDNRRTYVDLNTAHICDDEHIYVASSSATCLQP
jgi:hypothetical protein